MQKSNFSRKLLSVATAGVMTISAFAGTASAFATQLTAHAATVNELLGEGTFQDGKALPWHICESLTGKMDFVIQNGTYIIQVEDPGGKSRGGEDRWDCQFRHRNLTITEGNTYRITFSIWANKDMEFYSKLGDMRTQYDDMENWHMNGKVLDLSYDPSLDMDQLGEKLASASTTGKEVKYYEGWDYNRNKITAGKWTTYAFEFTVNPSDMDNHYVDSEGTGEWTFHFGGDGKWTDHALTEAGTVIKFDNLALINMTNNTGVYKPEEKYQNKGISVNQVGYFPTANKIATMAVDQGAASQEFQVLDSSGKAVYTGQTSATMDKDDSSWQYCQKLDFSSFQTPGTGYTLKCGDKTSLPFDIGTDIYDGMLSNSLNYFYQNRSGIDIKADYITSKGANESKDKLARAAGHANDVVYVTSGWEQVIKGDYESNDPKNCVTKPDGTNKVMGYMFKDDDYVNHKTKITVDHAWYDAGDHGKYVVNGGISVWTLNNLYEENLKYGKNSKKFADGSMLIPEDSNGYPDLLDETRWETDFFLSVQRDDGMVYHKVHDFKWTALCLAPADDPLERVAKPATYAATLNAAAAMAQSARLWKDYDSAYSTKLLTAAKKAYDAAKTNYVSKYGSITTAAPASTFTDPNTDPYFAPIEDGKGGGAYGDTDVRDEFYWAACELYITTGDASYKTDLSSYPDAFKIEQTLQGGENKGTVSDFTWGTLSSVGTFSLALHLDDAGLFTDAEKTQIKDSITSVADAYINNENDSAYMSPYAGIDYQFDSWSYDSTGDDVSVEGKTTTKTVEKGYEWGSNSMVLNNTFPMIYAYDLNTDASAKSKYANGVATAMNYILGNNMIEQSYVTGYGEHATKYVHHRWWSGEEDSSFPTCPDGVLSGGPNSQMQDPMISGAGYKQGTLAPQACYYDQLEAWSVNECTINWNSPLAYAVSFLEDVGPTMGSDEPTSSTTEATTATTTETTTTGNILWGDSDVDGTVNIADAVLAAKSVNGITTMTPQGIKNADCYMNDGKINLYDVVAIVDLCIGKYTQTDMPLQG